MHTRRTTQAKHNVRGVSGEGPETVRIWMLGGFRVSVGSRIVEEKKWRLRKAASLVKLLALEPGHRMHRERAMDLLWPELGPKAVANNLRQTLHAARRVLEPETSTTASHYLERQGEQLVLCPGGMLWVDVEAFEEAAATARRSDEPGAYRIAIDIYTGDLLPGDPYEEWAEERRDGLQRAYLALLLELAKLYEERERAEDAIEVLRRAVAAEPAGEEAHARLMRLYALSGRSWEALGQYERLREALSRELGTEPGAASRHLREEILAGRVPSFQPSRTGRPPEEFLGAGRHNLPAPRSSFVGREREIVEVKRTLAMTRLLTLTGTGGAGKTRLALEVVKDLVGTYPDGVWLVELAGLSEPELLPQEVADTLNVREQADHPLIDTLVETLSRKKLLLVLDNCEHLVDAVARLADALLNGCPYLRVLATSREPVRIVGEISWRVPSLATPNVQHVPTVEELEGYESARLFVERAQHGDPAFALTPRNAQYVSQICRRLEGIPLAIELAAARARMLSVEQIAERLDDCFRLLTTGIRTALPRHRTLRATIGWSHELLSEDERRLFRRLAVFVDGFTLAAAEAICSGDYLAEDEVLDLLSHLADKSLVVVQEQGGKVRYRLLETVRQYGWEKLKASGEVEAIRRRHGTFFLALVQEVEPRIEPKINNADRQMWLEQLEIEHSNLRAALRGAVDMNEAETGLRLASALFWFWHMRGYLKEGRSWLDRALAGGPVRTAVRAEALYHAGYLAFIQCDYPKACSQLKDSVATWQKLGGRQDGLAHALWLLGLVMLARGQPTVARSLAEKSVAIFRMREDNEFGLTMSLAILGIVASTQGNHALASSLLEDSLMVARKMEDDWALSLPLRYLGATAFRRGDHDRAVELLEESLLVLQESGENWYSSRSLECLATVLSMQGDHGRAARLFGAGEALREAIGASQMPFYLVPCDRGMAAARGALGEEAFAAAWAEGRAMTFEQAVEYALSSERETTSPIVFTPEVPPTDELSDKLTRREKAVAALITQGLPNRHIAEKLYVSERTVETHVRRILKKLGFSSRTQIAAWGATQRGPDNTGPR